MARLSLTHHLIRCEREHGLDPDLQAEIAEAKRLLRLYNRTESMDERQPILRQLLGRVGRNSIIEPPFFCSYGHNIYLGNHVYVNFMCTIFDNNEVRIGDHVMIGPVAQIYTAAHPVQAEPRIQGVEFAQPITIEDNVWIGGAAVILPGVTVGRNAVVGAGAVVTRDVPANTVVAGNPAKVVKQLDPARGFVTRMDYFRDPAGLEQFFDAVDRQLLAGNSLRRWLRSVVYPGSRR